MIEFKKEMDSKALTNQGKSGEEESGGFGGFGGSSNAAKDQAKVKSQKDALQAEQARASQANIDGLRPIWYNKENMSAVTKKLVQTKEIT